MTWILQNKFKQVLHILSKIFINYLHYRRVSRLHKTTLIDFGAHLIRIRFRQHTLSRQVAHIVYAGSIPSKRLARYDTPHSLVSSGGSLKRIRSKNIK
jgi:hypothetical protein